jgi:hypothetical protein
VTLSQIGIYRHLNIWKRFKGSQPPVVCWPPPGKSVDLSMTLHISLICREWQRLIDVNHSSTPKGIIEIRRGLTYLLTNLLTDKRTNTSWIPSSPPTSFTTSIFRIYLNLSASYQANSKQLVELGDSLHVGPKWNFRDSVDTTCHTGLSWSWLFLKYL